MSADDAIDSLNKVDSAAAFNHAQTCDIAPSHISSNDGTEKSQLNIWRCRNCGRQNKEGKPFALLANQGAAVKCDCDLYMSCLKDFAMKHFST